MIEAATLPGSLVDASSQLRTKLDMALRQQSTGRVAESFAGLGPAARTSLDARPAMARTQTWQDNIDRAASRLDVTQTALKQIAAVAQEFYARTNAINQVGVSEAGSIASSARLALQQVAQLLNTKVGDTYVFAGQDTANPPVPDTDPAVVGAALLASDTAPAPFSTTLGTVPPTIEVGEGQRVQIGLIANRNTLATSDAPTTGSYMRDVMRALAALATLTPGPAAEATAADSRTRLHGAIGAMATETGTLGDIQATLATRKTTLAATQTALNQQVSNAEDVDLAEVLTRISTLQTHLQASYQLIAGLKDLSLAKYL